MQMCRASRDHAVVTQQLRALLTSDYDLDIAQDGLALIDIVETSLLDVIVSDIAMPRISVMGNSAGANLTMLAAYSMGDPQLPPSTDV